ncbi:hypothetical protein MOBT1_000661 [Malassezia obtusa]|uniref:Protein Zds1 C-terminal domain-containing protein n=1 Tax=Malassezia obtusa TaxID=76774 RepID=A0AAF0E2H3_9BASI|nr:hypothetical protein MOBT1_000661 [Malassezia obtusa]
MANHEITDLELQREVEALRTRRRQSVNRVVLDPDLPDLQGSGLYLGSRPSIDSQASASSVASTSYASPRTPPDVDLGAFSFDENQINANPPLFGSSQRARHLARRQARAAQPGDAHEKGPLPQPPTAQDPPTSPSELLWVPAGAHPEISPADFRKFMKEQAERNVNHSETETSLSKRGSLSPPLDGQGGEHGEATVAANQLMRRNSSVARRSSSLRQQIRPEDREALGGDLPARPASGYRRSSLLAPHSDVSAPPERPPRREVPHAAAPSQLQTSDLDDDRSSSGTHATYSTESEHDQRPLPSPGASQLQRKSRNMKLVRPQGPAGPSRSARRAPRLPAPSPERTASTLEALSLDASSAPTPQPVLYDEPESLPAVAMQNARTMPHRSSSARMHGELPRRGNTLPPRLDESREAGAQPAPAPAPTTDLRAKAMAKGILPELPADSAPAAQPWRTLERVPVPSAPTPGAPAPSAPTPVAPAPAAAVPSAAVPSAPAPARRSEEEARVRPGPRPLPDPTRSRPEGRPLPEPKMPAFGALEPVVSPRVMERTEPRSVPPRPAAARPLSDPPRPVPEATRSSLEAARPVSESAPRPMPEPPRPVPEPPRPAPEPVRQAPEPPPRRSTDSLRAEPRAADAPKVDSPRSSRDKRGFGLSWFGLSKEDEDEDGSSKRRDKEERRKAKEAKEDVPPPPPLLPASASAPPPKRKDKDTFLANLFGKRKHHDQDTLRNRARTLFTGAGSAPPPAVVDDFPYARFPLHIERALYRLSHIKLANPRRALQEQVVISNLMFWYLGVINSAQSRPADIGNHHPRESGHSEYDEAERRKSRGTPPLAAHTGVLMRVMPPMMPQPYLPYNMGLVQPWAFPPGYPPGMYMDPQTQLWVPLPVHSEPATPAADYDVSDYVLDGYYTPTSPVSQDEFPREPPSAPMPSAPSWSDTTHTPTLPMHSPAEVSNNPPPLPEKSARDMRVPHMPMHVPGPGVHEAPGAMEKPRSRPASPGHSGKMRSLRLVRSTPALGPRKEARAVLPVPPVPPVPPVHVGRASPQHRS